MIRSDSIQSRLTLVALVVIIGSSLAVGLAGFRLTNQFLSRQFHQSFKLLAANMAGNAELGIMIDDRKMLDRLLHTMMAQQYVKGAAVYDSHHHLLVQENADSKGKVYGEKIRSITAPIRSLQMRNEALMISESGKYETVGYVELRYSLSGLEQLKADIARQFFFISLALVLAAVFVYWLMARLISLPLKNLVEVSKQVSQGDMDIRAQGGRFHETRILATTFNEMLTALGRQRRELRQMYEEMNRQQTLAEVGKFSLMMAHEVKNPLAIIRGSLDLLKKEDCDEKTKASLYTYLDEEINRINRLMEDFLLFARPKAPSFAQVEMGELVHNLAKRMELTGGNKQIKVKAPLPAKPCLVSCDVQLLERAMGNLVKNALEAGGESQPVTISYGLEKDRWYFGVEDCGPGIEPENLAKIFTPFFTTKAKGTGLGLAITREIIMAHGGKIGAENRKSGGAVFSFWIPGKRDV